MTATPHDLDRIRGTSELAGQLAAPAARVRPGAPPRVLFAATGFTRSLHALRRAHALATRLNGAELCVLQVAAPQRADVARDASAVWSVSRQVRRVCDRTLDPAPPAERVLTRSGDFVQVVVETARELGAALIVLAGTEHPKGAAVVQLARATGLPVLVARRALCGGSIVAATDLADPGYRVLRHAVGLASSLQIGLTFVHNVKPLVLASTSALGHCSCTVIEPPAESLAECRDRMQALARYLCVRAETVVASRPRAEDAILEAASAAAADLIVVGARRQSWLERVFGTALSARIVDRFDRSVLVAPLGAEVAALPLGAQSANA